MDENGKSMARGRKGEAAARAAAWQGWGLAVGVAGAWAVPWVFPWAVRRAFAGGSAMVSAAGVAAAFLAGPAMMAHGLRVWRREVVESKRGWGGAIMTAFVLWVALIGLAVAGVVGMTGLAMLGLAAGLILENVGRSPFWKRHQRGAAWIGLGVLGLWLSFVAEAMVASRGWGRSWAGELPFALAVGGAGVVLAGLAEVSGKGRRRWVRGAGAVLAALVAAEGVSWAVARREEGRADALLAEVLARCGAEADEAWAGAREPVKEWEDPVASLEGLAKEREDWTAYARARWKRERAGRLHPAAADERAYVRRWLEEHRELAVAAETVAEEGYRSCLPGARTAEDAARAREGEGYGAAAGWMEPRMEGGMVWAGVLELRAAAAFADGDAAGGSADWARLERLAERAEGECGGGAGFMAEAIRDAAAGRVLPEAVGRWPEEALEEAVREAERVAERGREDWLRQAAREVRIGDARCRLGLPGLPKGAGMVPGAQAMGIADREPGRLCGARARWFWIQRDRCAMLRDWARTLDATERMEALPPGEERAAAWAEYEREAEERAETTLLFGGAWKGRMWRRDVFGRRTRAEFVRASVAVERWRRAHGGARPATIAEATGAEGTARDAWSGEKLAYEAGPLEIPAETGVPDGGEEERAMAACRVDGWRLGWSAESGKDGERGRRVAFWGR